MNSTISVIISAYNAANTIHACLQSLQDQTINIEIIVVDDGSTDGTGDVVKQFMSVKLITQPHQGPGSARNRGAAKAGGDILVFVDADMTFETDFIEHLVKPIVNSNAVGTFTKDEYVSNWNNWWARCWNYEYTNAKTHKRIAPDSPNHSPVFRAITKEAFHSVQGFSRGGYDDDWSLSKKLDIDAVVAPKARMYHQNPGTAKAVFDHAVWVSTRTYKAGVVGKLIAFIRANPLLSIVQGIGKAFRFREPAYLPFKLVYNAGISWGLLKEMPWIMVLVALTLRLPELNGSFWLDEAAQALESARPLWQQFNLVPDFQPPLFHLIVHMLNYMSQENWWLRLASLVPGIMTVWFVYLTGKLLYSKTVGLWAALFLATSPFHVFYSQELRPYSLAAFFAVWSMYELIKKRTNPGNHLYRLGFINAAGLYTMYLYPFFLISQFAIVLLWYRHLLKPFIHATLVSVLLFFPWLPMFLKQLSTGTGWLESSPGWGSVVSPPLLKMIPLTLVKAVYGRLIIDQTVRDVILLGLYSVPFVIGTYVLRRLKKKHVLLTWIVLPILIAFLVSIKIPVLDPKRVLFILPAIYLLIAYTLSNLRHGLWLLVLIVMLNGVNLTRYWIEPINQREPWQQAIRDISQVVAAEDALTVFAFPEPFAPWNWYEKKNAPTLSFVPNNETESSLHSILSLYTGYKTIIVFDYLMDLTDTNRKVHHWLTTHGYQLSNVLDYPGIGFIRIFRIPSSYASGLLR